MSTVSGIGVVSMEGARELALPASVEEALGELVDSAKEGLLALSVGVGLGVLAEIDGGGGRRGRGPEGQAQSGAHRGPSWPRGRRGHARRPAGRGQASAGADAPTASARSGLGHMSTSPIAIRCPGTCSSRCSPASPRAVTGARSSPSAMRSTPGRAATSKSAVSRDVRREDEGEPDRADEPSACGRAPGGDDARRDRAQGPLLRGRAWGSRPTASSIPLGLWDGSTENATVANALLSNLVDRGLDLEQGVLFVIDGSKALRKAITEVLGAVAGAELHPSLCRLSRYADWCGNVLLGGGGRGILSA